MADQSTADGILAQLLWSLRHRGIARTIGVIRQRFRQGQPSIAPTLHPFDLEHGTDTSGLISGRQLKAGHAHDVFTTGYFGTPPSRLRQALARWRATDGVVKESEYTFIDIGCGKGRMLLVASEFAFHQIHGIELHQQLVDAAQKNIEIWTAKGSTRSPIHAACADATTLSLPPGPILIYMYNPFGAPVMQRLLAHLVDLNQARKSVIDILYLYPVEAKTFTELPQFHHLWTEEIGLSPDERLDEISAATDTCALYRLQGHA